jgi:hypothetical protein
LENRNENKKKITPPEDPFRPKVISWEDSPRVDVNDFLPRKVPIRQSCFELLWFSDQCGDCIGFKKCQKEAYKLVLDVGLHFGLTGWPTDSDL